MKLRITGDGSPYGTRVVNAKTGEELTVLSLEIRQIAAGPPTAVIEVYNIEFDMTVDVCASCMGSGRYVGLNEQGPCEACSGTGRA